MVLRRRPDDKDRTSTVARDFIDAPSGRVLRVPPQHVVVLLEDPVMERDLVGHLDARGVTAQAASSSVHLLGLCRDRVPAAIVTADRGDGVPGGALHDALRRHHDERLRALPLVVVHTARVSALTTYGTGVRLVRAPIGARALSGVVCSVLAQQPHVVVREAPADPLPRPRRTKRTPVRDGARAYSGVLRGVRVALEGATAQIAAQIERVGEHFEIRCAEPFSVERDGELVLRVAWNTPRAERFSIEAEGELPSQLQSGRLTLLPQRGLRGALSSLLGLERRLGDRDLDDAFLIHADDDALGLMTLGRRALLSVARNLRSLEQLDDRLCVSLEQVPRHELAAMVEASVELWRAAHRERA